MCCEWGLVWFRNKEKRRLKWTHRLIQVVNTREKTSANCHTGQPNDIKCIHHTATRKHTNAVEIDGFENGPTTTTSTVPECSVGPAIERMGEHKREKYQKWEWKRKECDGPGGEWLGLIIQSSSKFRKNGLCAAPPLIWRTRICNCVCVCMWVWTHHIQLCTKSKTETRWMVINYLVHLVLNTLAFST